MTSAYQEITHQQQDQGDEDDENDNMGTGRSYFECVFCKRGFTNAQALGGHMNIHRRDRARTGRTRNSLAVNSNQQQPIMIMNNDYSMHGGLNSWPNSSSHDASSRAKDQSNTHAPRNYNKYFSPSSTSKTSSSSRHNNINIPAAPQPLSLFNEDHRYTNLGLRVGRRHEEGEEERRQLHHEEEEHEVDLELRLGT